MAKSISNQLSTPPLPAKRKRRWLSFSLKTLLIAMTVIGVWLGMRGSEVYKQRRAREALAKVVEGVCFDHEWEADASLPAGGRWNYQAAPRAPAWLIDLVGEDFFSRVTCVYLRHPQEATDGAKISAADLTCLKDLPYLEEIGFFSDADIDEESIAILNDLPHLKRLAIAYSSDDELRHIGTLKHLELLDVTGPQVTSEGMRHLQSAPRLQCLSLVGTRIDGKGVDCLRQQTNLKTLVILGAKFGDADTAAFEQMTGLQHLVLHATRISPQGAQRLQAALPNCKVDIK